MSLQVHAVMEQSEHIDQVCTLTAGHAEHDDVSALAPIARHMERMYVVAYFRAPLDPNDRRAGIQCF